MKQTVVLKETANRHMITWAKDRIFLEMLLEAVRTALREEIRNTTAENEK